MPDGDDLPDTDYASLYGWEALHARQDAQLRALDATLRRLDAQYAVQRARLRVLLERHDHADPDPAL